jgi:hypothetical protein
VNHRSSAWSGERPRNAGDRARRQSRSPVQEKQPPHSVEAEMGVLSSIMHSPREAIGECVAAGVQSHWFYVPAHRTFYVELRDAWDSDQALDMISFTQRLRDKGLLAEIGGAGAVVDLQLYLDEVFDFRPTIEYLPEHIGIVRDLYVRRELFDICSRGARLSYDPILASDSDNVSVLDVLESRLASLRSLQSANDALPQIEDAAPAVNGSIELPPDVIEGILHQCGKMVAGGSSKTFKTWLLIDLGVCVSNGFPWLNGWTTRKGRVLYINLELPKAYCDKRIQTICDEHQSRLEPGMLDVWHLRGYAMRWPELQRRIRSGVYTLIILDPIYKVLLGRAENQAETMTALMNELEAVAVRTGAAVAFGAHYSKGNQAMKEAIDRISGSGVFARDPDTILNFTKHEEKNCFTVELTLRNHPPRKPFVVRWEYPLFIPESLLDPTKLKKVGRPQKYDPQELLELIDEPMLASEIVKLAKDELGIDERRVFELLRELKRSEKLIQPQKRGKYERV